MAKKKGLVDPFALTDADGYMWLKGNLHSHSTNSDGKVSPQERVDGYVKAGYDYLCVSDHHTITRIDTVSCPEDFTLIQGVELHPDNPFGGQRHHFLALNMKEDMDAGKMPPQHVIDAVIKQGGSVWLAHPHWSSVNILRDTLPLNGLAGIEVFNTTCRCMGRGESSVHWDNWMELSGQILPAMANDDAHAAEATKRDTYHGWTMVRVKNRTAKAIVNALATGASYSSSGPEIRNIQLKLVDNKKRTVEATVSSSKAQRIFAVCDSYGVEYHTGGKLFETATFTLRPGAKYVRFEIVDAKGYKAWSNPYDLTRLKTT
ncbi:MAG: PHP domain-containing protein [Candidatus Latescibacterota bacterium]